MTFNYGTFKKNNGMTLLEVLVGFVIFSASLVAILEYVSNQVYLNHQTEKNERKAHLIYEYSLFSELGPDATSVLASSQSEFNLLFSSTPVDSFKNRKAEIVLVKTLVSVEDGAGTYDWAIMELQ